MKLVKKDFSFTLILLLFSLLGFSQNLVLNGSFEEFETCPKDYSQFDDNVNDWFDPTKATPDLFSGCEKYSPLSVPNNSAGWQKAKHGNSYAGLYLLLIYNGREYITGKLKEQLIKNKRYKMKFYISLSDQSGLSINSIGVLFNSFTNEYPTVQVKENSKSKKSSINQRKYIDLSYQSEIDSLSSYHNLTTDHLYDDQKNWMPIEFEFVANGGEKFFTIGNFKSDLETKYKLTRKKIQYATAYYYIDDVSIEKIDNQITADLNYQLNSIYTLKSVLFNFDKATLIKETTKELDQLITYLNAHLELKVTINGHTDYLGTVAYNLKLSTERAKSVAEYLSQKGIDASRITSKGYGESRPIDPNEDEDAQAKNRRVEFMLSR